MHVSHVNTFLDGGAGTAARRLHGELGKSGIDSRFYYSRQIAEPEDLDPTYQAARWPKGGLNEQLPALIRFRIHRESFKRLVRQRPEGYEVFSSPRGMAHTQWPPIGHPVPESDRSREVIHLHWVSKLIDYKSFFESMSPDQPIVWTLHDMNAFTGGCHFSGGCLKYSTGCGNCPQLPQHAGTDFSQRFFAEKQAALSQLNLNVVAPSRWLLQAAQSSPVFEGAKSFEHIPYGISTQDYYPMDRDEARQRLGIDPDAVVVSFGAMDLKNRRKGARHLIRALSALADIPNVVGLVFGSGELPQAAVPLPSIRHLGLVQGRLQQRTVYSASDIFVLPSLEDNLPLTGLEAMACGTAIVGFDAGGIPDYVLPNETGLLARVGDAQQLGQKLRDLATQPELAQSMGQTARRIVEQRYTAQRESMAYQNLYARLVDSNAENRESQGRLAA